MPRLDEVVDVQLAFFTGSTYYNKGMHIRTVNNYLFTD